MKNSCNHGCRVAFMVTTLALAVSGGCDEKGEQGSRSGSKTPAMPVTLSAIGPDASAIPVDMSEGWCGGHGVPESVCTRCDTSLIPQFKSANDWCGEHDLPETQCILCNPEVQARWVLASSGSRPRVAADSGRYLRDLRRLWQEDSGGAPSG